MQQLDWFTVAAEVVNFLILVFLLKRFLYDRIIGVAEAREEKIASQMAEAEARQQEAEEDAEAYRQQRRELAEKREAMLEDAREDAEERRRELVRAARSEVEKQQAEWYAALARQQQRFLRQLHQHASRQLYAVANRVLADLADAELEAQVVDVFIQRLRHLDEEERQTIVGALDKSDAVVRSAFPISAEQRDEIVDALHQQLSQELSAQFAEDEALVCGLALRVNGHQVTWNVTDYLARLEQEVQENLEETLRRELGELPSVNEEVEQAGEQESNHLDERIEAKVRAVLEEEAAGADGSQEEVG